MMSLARDSSNALDKHCTSSVTASVANSASERKKKKMKGKRREER